MSFDLSPEKLALLDALLDDDGGPEAIAPRAERSSAPLSYGQERLWFVERLLAGSPAYNIPVVIDLDGPLDVPAFERALQAVTARHEMLRARVRIDGDRPCWQIEDRDAPFELLETESVAADELERSEATTPFDLEQGPLWRVKLLRIGPAKHRLLFTMHHIISEAWTCALLLREVSAHMRGESLPPNSLDFGDFAAWQREQDDEAGLAVFAKHLAGQLPVLEIPGDRPRPAVRRFVGGWVERWVSPERNEALKQFVRDQQATLHMALLTAYGTLLYRWTGQTDLVVGTPVSLRTRVELESMVGFFVNTVAIRQQVDPDQSFSRLLSRTRDSALDAFSNRSVPFEKVVDRVAPRRSTGQNPIFQVAMVVQDTPENADWRRSFDVPGIDSTPRIRPSGTAKFDLTLEAEEGPAGLRIALEYDSDLLDRETAEAFLEQLDRVLEAAVSEPEKPVGAYSLLSETERETITLGWNPEPAPLPTGTIHGRFAEVARERSDAVAIVDADRTVTYAELDRWTDAIASRLHTAGATPGEPIAIVVPRSAELVAAMLGTLKAGCAYLPLDASYPPERRAFMLEDANVQRVLVSDPNQAEGRTHVSLGPAGDEPAPPLADVGPDGLAYVLFTSGSTGRPKGVLTPHRGVLRLVRDTNYVSLGPDDVLPQLASASFDAITFEVWGALLNGGRVAIIQRDDILDSRLFAAALRREGATAMFLTTALFNRVAAEVPRAFSELRVLLVGGEALDPKWIRRVLRKGPPARLLNGYGPTEVTTFAVTHEIREVAEDAVSVPIGRAISGTAAYVLDERMQLTPPGVYGELHLGGPGVALGYLGRPELTAERFVDNPFGEGTLYRTGDVVRWRREGTIDFAGRRDHQVKLRGFRIELGEIEARLEDHPAVAQAVCVVRGESQYRRLVAFMTGSATADEARAHLRGLLPPHMVPNLFVSIAALPLDPNGKVDRRALPDQAVSSAERAPLRTHSERVVGAAFAQVIEARDVRADDDFFALGGSSLLALPLVRILSERFGVDLPLATLFRSSTVAALASELDSLRLRPPRGAETLRFGPLPMGAIRAFPFEPLVPIQPEGHRAPVYCVHGAGGNVVSFRGLSQHLGEERPFYALQAQGIDGVRPPLETIEEMATQYVEALVAHDRTGPYTLAGYSGGGVIAFEVAHQLKARGLCVSAVVMLDAGAGRERPETLRDKQTRRFSGLRRGGFAYLSEKISERVAWDLWRARAKLAEVQKWRGRAIPHQMRNRYMVEAFARARKRYVLRALDVPLVVLSAQLGTREAIDQAELGWKTLAPSVKVYNVPGDHGSLLLEPHVRRLAAILESALRALDI